MNEAERESWSGEPGRAWVRWQGDLDQMMEEVGRLLLDRASLPQDARVLDVGCGTGATALAAARRVGPRGHVTGFDLSAPLLDAARARAEGAVNVTFAEGDAQVDLAPEGPFDAMISRFGVMFFADPVAAFRNLATQLVPGARLTAVAWASATENPWFAVPHRLAEERLGPVPASDPDAPGPTAFRDAGRVLGILDGAGLRDAAAEPLDVDLHHPGGPEAVSDLALRVGPAARLLRLKGGTDEDRAALRSAICDALAPFAARDGIRVPARVILYSAWAA